MDRLGIDHLTVLGLPPVQFVQLAAALGCRNISTVFRTGANPLGYPAYDLAEDAPLRREMIAAMRDLGVSISLFESIVVRRGGDIRDRAPDLAILLELGVTRASILSFDPDLPRTLDQFALFAEMAAPAGIEIVLEFAPALSVPDLATAVRAVRHVGRPGFKLLIDTMHLARTGGTAADLAALAPDLIGYIQLCDVPLMGTDPNYLHEATTARLAPGEGELPLFDFLAAMPRDLVVGLEVPQVAKALAGEGPHERVGAVVTAARALLGRLPAERVG